MPEEEHEKKLTQKHAYYTTMRIKTSRQDSNVYLKFLCTCQLTSFLSCLWYGRIISRRWLWNDRSWNLLHLGHLNFTVRLRHSLCKVFFAENSWGKIGISTFVLGADQRLSGEGVFNDIYYCPLGFRVPCTCIPLCMRLFILMFWLRASILIIVNGRSINYYHTN